MKKDLIKNLHSVLGAIGFTRKSSNWNRQTGDFTDVINIQTSQFSSNVTVNLGILLPIVHSICWQEDLSGFIKEPECTIRIRLGRLVTGLDEWWDVNDPSTAEKVAQLTHEYGLPFLNSMHSVNAMIHSLETTLSQCPKPYPPEGIYLAILKSEKGEFNEAYRLLDTFDESISEGWKIRARAVKTRIMAFQQKLP